MIRDLFKYQATINIISVILGLGLATLFNRACTGDGCVIYQLPKGKTPEMIENNTFSINDKCYKYMKSIIA